VLKTASPNDLIGEFSAIRASQGAGRELKGIVAQDLHTKRALDALNFGTASAASPATASDVSPVHPHERWGPRPALRTSRSADAFARPASLPFHPLVAPLSPPARRRASRAPARLPNMPRPPWHEPGAAPPSGDGASHSPNPSHPARSRQSPALSDAGDAFMGALGIAQAVTTPDDSAFVLGSDQPPPAAALADVPEEDEASPWEKMASRPSRPTTAVRRGGGDGPIPHPAAAPPGPSRHAVAKASPRPYAPVPPASNHRFEPKARGTSEPRNLTVGLDGGWEDDIDYCYEHAMEAEDAFESSAGRSNVTTTFSPLGAIGRMATQPTAPPKGQQHPPAPRAPTFDSLVSQRFHVPRNRPPSMMHPAAASTNRHGVYGLDIDPSAATVPGIAPAEPSHSLSLPRSSSGSVLFPLSPSLLVPTEYTSRVTHDEPCYQNLADGDSGKPGFSLYGHAIDGTIRRDDSPRSSSSLLSKCGSADSMFPSRDGSIDRRHQKSGSVGSLPELVHSRSGRDKHAPGAEPPPTGHLALLHVAHNPAELSMVIEAARQDLIRKAGGADRIAGGNDGPPMPSAAPAIPPKSSRRPRPHPDSVDRILDVMAAAPVGLTLQRMHAASTQKWSPPEQRQPSRPVPAKPPFRSNMF
jgi:hypothetical protein